MKKNDVIQLACQSLGSAMEGVGRSDGMAVFVPGLLPGETGEVQIVKVQSRFAYGKLLRLTSLPSPCRRVNDCPVYPRCGGCAARHMTYEASLEGKRAHVASCFERIAKLPINVPPVIGMEHPFAYRNKIALPVGGTTSDPSIGFYAPRSHQLIHAPHCLNAMAPANDIAHSLLEWIKAHRISPYQEENHQGLIRHLVVRVNRHRQAMVTLVINGDTLPHAASLISALSPLGVISLYISINQDRTNAIFGSAFRKLYGADTLSDTLCGLEFELSPSAFFQVNPEQTERLYHIVRQFAALKPEDEAVDLYCGAGTITLMLARDCARITGIEVVPEAIENAKGNALRNGICNAEFFASAAETLLPQLAAQGIHPRVMVADPPRKGMDPAVGHAIAQAAPERLVYVSCDVATQARDAALLHTLGYVPRQIQPVDMFCWTGGVENVVLFTK